MGSDFNDFNVLRSVPAKYGRRLETRSFTKSKGFDNSNRNGWSFVCPCDVSNDVFTVFVFFFGVGFDFVVGVGVFISVVVDDAVAPV